MSADAIAGGVSDGQILSLGSSEGAVSAALESLSAALLARWQDLSAGDKTAVTA